MSVQERLDAVKSGIRVGKVVSEVLKSGAHTGTLYVSESLTVRCTRPLYKGKFDKRNETFVVRIGKPNYRARKFIALAKKAGESFPINRVIFVYPATPKARTALKS